MVMLLFSSHLAKGSLWIQDLPRWVLGRKLAVFFSEGKYLRVYFFFRLGKSITEISERSYLHTQVLAKKRI